MAGLKVGFPFFGFPFPLVFEEMGPMDYDQGWQLSR